MPGSAPGWRKRRSAIPGSKSPGTGSQGRGQAALAAHHLERGLHLLPGRGKAWAAIPSDLKGGVIVHDGFVPYGALGQIDHALCNAHHLREPKALIERDGSTYCLGASATLPFTRLPCSASPCTLRRLRPVLDWLDLGTRMEVLMRSKFLKVALGCGFAAALVAPAAACEFNKTSAQNDQPMAQSQQTTPDAPQTAQSQPADTGSN